VEVPFVTTVAPKVALVVVLPVAFWPIRVGVDEVLAAGEKTAATMCNLPALGNAIEKLVVVVTRFGM
jgi:hypothetical protein